MASPRKFSEKIALHNRRQTEETIAFEKIMKEVSDVTTRPSEEPPTQQKIPTYRQGSRARSPGGPMRRHNDRKLDTSPYSSGPYLSPPTDTGWRRTNSDSALHQSAMQGINIDRNDSSNRTPWAGMLPMSVPDRVLDGRPRSSCEVPRVPGIHIYPSVHDPGIIQIPIGNNTGSLPDLTNVDFTSPIHIPLDQDQDNSSPYSSSPINTSPSTLSPTSIPQSVRSQGGRFQYTTPISHPHSNSTIENHIGDTVAVEGPEYTQLGNIYQQQCPPTSPSPTMQQAAGYRSPRPSPQSSPGLAGRHSAPCSPGAPSPLSNDYQIFSPHQAAQFQQHFEQLSMLDTPSSTSYVDQSAPSPQMTAQSHSQRVPEPTANNSMLGNIEIPPEAAYYGSSPSHQPFVYPSTSPGLQNTTPNTPNSLPEIILTDFSGEDASRQDIAKHLESDFFTDEQLREGLVSLDFDELQIFNSSVGMSEIVEENFNS